MTKGPVLIDLEASDAAPPSPAEAPPVLDAPLPDGRAMQTLARTAARPPSRLWRWFWQLLTALLVFGLSLWAWDFVTGLVARNQVLGTIAIVVLGLFLLVCAAILLRELAALSRLARLDAIHREAEAATASNDIKGARKVVDRILGIYRNREDTTWGTKQVMARRDEVFDADALFALTETSILKSLDAAATAEVEAASRQVATVTALVPLALADVVAALTSNLRMIRRIAEIYGGRGGTLGSWRLTRAVLGHLVATGAVAVGDDMFGSIAGGGVLSKISRRFGEGLVNGALTARVGIAAMEVCRPLPFSASPRPSVTGTVRRALTGLFGMGQSEYSSDSAPR